MSVNLLDLSAGTINYNKALLALEKLGNANEGPLRVTIIKSVPSLGVRTWTQFFDEYFFGDLDVWDREKETADIFETYLPRMKVRICGDKSASRYEAKMHRLNQAIYKLRAKIKRRDLSPKTQALSNVILAATRPGFKNGETCLTSIKSFREKISVPLGLSMAAVPIKKVIADLRIGRFLNYDRKYKYGESKSIDIPDKFNELSKRDYYSFYLGIFNSAAKNNKSITIELVPDLGRDVSDDNRNAAWRAASEFVAKRKVQGNPVSILICLDKLPGPNTRAQKSTNPQDASDTPNATSFGTKFRVSNDVLEYESEQEEQDQ